MLNKRVLGQELESRACEFLAQNGAKIIERNYRCKSGEIDIIARDEKYLCFIEVKYRSGDRFGSGEDAVGINKQRKICKVSEFYLYSKYKSIDLPVRYDVVAISQTDSIYTFDWIKNAFEYIY